MISFDIVSLFASVKKDMVLKAVEENFQTLQKGFYEDFHVHNIKFVFSIFNLVFLFVFILLIKSSSV